MQTEYSLWSRDVEDGILPECKEIGIDFVAYSPLGKDFFTGQIQHFDNLAEDDYCRCSLRFQGENFYKNLDLVKRIEEIANQKGVKSSQLALAWLLAQDAVPIAGTKRVNYLEENIEAADIELTKEELAQTELWHLRQ
ncbi:aldo/keto reductase [Jeotgalibacillus soli]|uniref:Aldo/keto reductase n=1 Tax=Jeotgalibacillus soli TaxID=889306 RepID=A0A0C2V0T7_9BACL|nr:aldo/keto reductase [Jeotgalibacillus soli]